MSRGLDTTFLIQVELREHPGHEDSAALLHRLLRERAPLALAPQVLAEFVHIATDPRRFELPLTMESALARAQMWWESREVKQVFPTPQSTSLFLRWMGEHRLGRKRLLDTHLAATYQSAGVTTLVTTNARDYEIFGCFEVLTPSGR